MGKGSAIFKRGVRGAEFVQKLDNAERAEIVFVRRGTIGESAALRIHKRRRTPRRFVTVVETVG